MEVSTGSALRQWQHGSALEVVIQIHTLSVEAARAPAKPWTVAPRFPFGKSARDSCSTRGHSAWSRCRPSSVAATAPLKQTVALQYPDRYITSAPVTSRSGGRRGRRSQSPWELPSPRLQPSSCKGALPRRPETGSPCPVVRSGPTSIWWGRYARARKTLPQDRCPGHRSVRLPSNKLPEQTWRGRAREGPKRQESHVCSPDTATMGRPKRAMYVKLAMRRCVRASRVDRLTWSYQGKHTQAPLAQTS